MKNTTEYVVDSPLPENEKFKLLFSNLISNALKFSVSEDKITLLAKDCLLRIKRINAKGIGAGLDLPIVKQFIRLHNGKMTVEIKEGEGTTFHVFIPEQE